MSMLRILAIAAFFLLTAAVSAPSEKEKLLNRFSEISPKTAERRCNGDEQCLTRYQDSMERFRAEFNRFTGIDGTEDGEKTLLYSSRMREVLDQLDEEEREVFLYISYLFLFGAGLTLMWLATACCICFCGYDAVMGCYAPWCRCFLVGCCFPVIATYRFLHAACWCLWCCRKRKKAVPSRDMALKKLKRRHSFDGAKRKGAKHL
jgi:hypothetical protein